MRRLLVLILALSMVFVLGAPAQAKWTGVINNAYLESSDSPYPCRVNIHFTIEEGEVFAQSEYLWYRFTLYKDGDGSWHWATYLLESKNFDFNSLPLEVELPGSSPLVAGDYHFVLDVFRAKWYRNSFMDFVGPGRLVATTTSEVFSTDCLIPNG